MVTMEQIDEMRRKSFDAKAKAEDPLNTDWERGYYRHDFKHFEDVTGGLLQQYHKERDELAREFIKIIEDAWRITSRS